MKSTVVLALALVGAATMAVAARRDPAPSATVYRPATSPGAALDAEPTEPESSGEVVSGDVRETFDVAEYTYLRLATSGGETWAAVSKTSVSVGAHAQILHAARMDNFTSTTLKRTFPVIYFGELAGSGTASLPPGHPDIAASPHAARSVGSAAPEVQAVQVSRAPSKNGHTIVELFAEREKLDGQRVSVRGQVVKVTSGVQGKNYVRLRDGSSNDEAQRELVVTTQAELQVGDVITLEGQLRRDVDVGIGYKYPLLLENGVSQTDL